MHVVVRSWKRVPLVLVSRDFREWFARSVHAGTLSQRDRD